MGSWVEYVYDKGDLRSVIPGWRVPDERGPRSQSGGGEGLQVQGAGEMEGRAYMSLIRAIFAP